MIRELIGQEADILLHGYNSYSFKEEQSVIFFKGSIHLSNEKADIEKWSKLLISQSTYERVCLQKTYFPSWLKCQDCFL